MFIVHVFIHVKEAQVEAFKEATVENAQKSLKESGVVRFDVCQEQKDSTHFVLVEIYKTEDDSKKHKDTDHYKKWRDTVEDLMAEPRYSTKYLNVFPEDQNY